MIIGISGKIGSGKDTIGKIIQLLTEQYIKTAVDYELLIRSLDKYPDSLQKCRFDDSPFVIKKFADKLKDMVCLLIGCTRDQLEDINFKNKPLGKEWDIKVHRETESLTPRKILQLLGTECGRQIIHNNIWINALFADYKPNTDATKSEWFKEKGFPDIKVLKATDLTTYSKLKVEYYNSRSYWVITDVRFVNEAETIKDKKGILIRVNRKVVDAGLTNYMHESEIALDNYTGFDYTIDNNGSINGLVQTVYNILRNHEII